MIGDFGPGVVGKTKARREAKKQAKLRAQMPTPLEEAAECNVLGPIDRPAPEVAEVGDEE